MFLTRKEEEMLNGEMGETIQKSMEILVALGDIYNAEKLVDISSAQVSGVSYKTIGSAGLEYLEDLAKDKSVKCKIPCTLNPAGVDLENWESLGFSEDFAIKQDRIVNAYSALGVSSTCTCTPYLIGNVPLLGDHVSWSESSAVAYGNSVLGVKTNREGGPGALAAAICGKTAYYGYHLDENRIANLHIDVECDLNGIDYGALGYLIGQEVNDGVPYFKLNNKPKTDNLKSLGAALASSGAVTLYHVENITPEYHKASIENVDDTISLERKDIDEAISGLSTTNNNADLICLGCPHASLEEIRDIANILENKHIANELWVCTSINIKVAAERMGYVDIIESAGGKVVCDTCMVVAPIEDFEFKVIGVNSAKAANYVPSMCGLDVVYGELEDLIILN